MTADHPVIGVTGTIGSGKSTVAALMEKLGAGVVDADRIGRRVVEESGEFREWLRDRFGPEIFDGEKLKRAALGRIVFRDVQAREELDRAIRPYIHERLDHEIGEVLRSGRTAVVDAALIFEWNDEERFDIIVAVIADPEIAARRAAARLGISVGEVRDRFAMQLPPGEKARRADVVIRNNGSLQDLEDQTRDFWQRVVIPFKRN